MIKNDGLNNITNLNNGYSNIPIKINRYSKKNTQNNIILNKS